MQNLGGIIIFSLFNLLILPLLGSIISNSYPDVLSSEEEKIYLERLKNGDQEARAILIEHNLRLVAHIVKKYENTNEEKDDLLSIGSYGLIKAVDSYNFDSQVKLGTYASRCIENEILMHLRTLKRQKETIWLYQTIGEDKEGNEIKLVDIIEDPSTTPLNKACEENEAKIILDALNVLTENEKEIINLRYGLIDNIPLTQKEIATKLNISRSYVSRIEKRALTKIYLVLKKTKK